MRFSITTAAALLAGAVNAQNFRLVAQVYNGVPGEIYQMRAWYGDGNLYVGSWVPASVETAMNITVPDWSATAPQPIVGPVDPEDSLPAGTFFAINNSTGATDPLVFTHDESSLGEGWISSWIRYGTIVLPSFGGTETPLESSFYLEETEESGTSIITWRTPGTPSEGLQNIDLLAIL